PPLTHFSLMDIPSALSHLQKASHIGKLVLIYPEQNGGGEWKERICLFNDRSTYIIAGGGGGIGFETGKWMVTQGAKNIVLCGRNLPKKENQKIIETINKKNGELAEDLNVEMSK